MKTIDKLEKEIKELERYIEKAEKENALLKDEVESLWAMMDEISKSDIKNYKHLVDELKTDVITQQLMTSKKKVDC